jgi:lipopolysaccharide transport system ATP-binding protein
MGQVARTGRTVLFVSHNMAAVQNLCNRGVVLEGGRVVFVGSEDDAVGRYLTGLAGPSLELAHRTDRQGSGEMQVTGIEFRDADGNLLTAAASGQTIEIVLHYRRTGDVSPKRILAGVAIKTELDVPVFLQHNRLSGDVFSELPEAGAFVCHLPDLLLAPGSYRITYSILQDDEYIDRLDDAARLTVIGGAFYGAAEAPPASHGPVLVRADWRVEQAGLVVEERV